MADLVITAPIGGAPNQAVASAASSGNATTGSVVIVVASTTTNRQLYATLRTAMEAVRRDSNVFTG